MVYRIVILFAVAFFALKVESYYPNPCDDFTLQQDFSNPLTLKYVEDGVLNILWHMNEQKLTDNGKELRKIYKSMALSTNKLWRRTAIIGTQWIWAYVPQVDISPNLCSIARMINTTVSLKNRKVCATLNTALEKLNVTMSEGTLLALDTGARNSGCDISNRKKIKSTIFNCYKDGFVYNFQELWEMESRNYPRKYKEIINKMYHSTIKIDNMMALFGTASISKYFASMLNYVGPAVRYQIAFMAASHIVPKQCCNGFFRQSDNLHTRMIAECTKALINTQKDAQCSPP